MYLKGAVILVLALLYIILRTPCLMIAGSLFVVVICLELHFYWGRSPFPRFVPQLVQWIVKPLLVVTAGLSACIFVFAEFVTSYAEQVYSYNAWDRMALRRIVRPFRPVPAALAAHRESHNSYPTEFKEIDATLPPCASALSSVHNSKSYCLRYQKREAGYLLDIKLSWDGSLRYYSGGPEALYDPGHWMYDPGNGDPSWPID